MTKKKADKRGRSDLSKARLREHKAIEKCLARRKGRVDIASVLGFPPMKGRSKGTRSRAPGAGSPPKAPAAPVPGKKIILEREKRDNIPQPKESFFVIPNQIFDQGLMGEITRTCKGTVPCIVWLLMYRCSYGFGRNYTQISLPQIVRCLGISRRAAIYALRALEEHGYIRKYKAGNGQPVTYIVGLP